MSDLPAPDTKDRARSLELIYALSRYPQRISTFVNGEAAILARHVESLRIVAEKRSAESDLRPGGIPAATDVQWTPKRHQPAFWLGAALAFLREPARFLGELRAVARPVHGFAPKRRWAYSAAAAAAYGARLPDRDGLRHVHAHFAATGGVIAHAISRTRRLPFSVTVHGSADLFRANPHLGLLLRDASLVVAVSAYHRGVILERVDGLDPDRVVVIHVGVPTDELERRGGAIEAREAESPARIVSVANLGPTKGMPVLIDAVARLVAAGRTVTLDIIGDGPLRTQLAAQVARMGLDDVVRLRGATEPARAHAAMSEADLFALACVRTPEGAQDGIPTVLMEAMASGTPVISTRLSGIPELIEDGVTGWLARSGDVDAIAAAIADALDRPDEAARRARAAREHVRLNFDQERNALALLDAILRTRRDQNASR